MKRTAVWAHYVNDSTGAALVQIAAGRMELDPDRGDPFGAAADEVRDLAAATAVRIGRPVEWSAHLPGPNGGSTHSGTQGCKPRHAFETVR